MKLVDIEDGSAIVGLVSHPVVLPTQSASQGKVWGYLPLILNVRQIKGAPILAAAPGGGELDLVEEGGGEGGVGRTGAILKVEVVIGGFALIQPNPANLDTGL
jgi:hypothetical protein